MKLVWEDFAKVKHWLLRSIYNLKLVQSFIALSTSLMLNKTYIEKKADPWYLY
jgi:hypothetical protein